MLYLADTNVLLRFSDRKHPLYPTIQSSIRRLRSEGHILKVAFQNCVELWNVATRPVERNGLGLTPAKAERLLNLIERLFPLLLDTPAVYAEWRRLVFTYSVSGVQVHDARLVATMKTNKVTHILTLNTRDFSRYSNEGIVGIDPGHS